VGLAVKSTTHEAWEAIQKVRLGADRVKEANAERLRHEFGDIIFKPGDHDLLSIDEAVGHLCTVEQRKKPPPAKESGGHLLLTEEEWMARMKTRDDSVSNAGAHSGDDNNNDGKNSWNK
jgi:hypothetical protein